MWFRNTLVICSFITNDSKAYQLKRMINVYIISQFSVGQGVQGELSWWSWLRISLSCHHDLIQGCIIWRSDWGQRIHYQDGSLTRLTSDANCWQGDSSSSPCGPSHRAAWCLYDMAAGFPQSKWFERVNKMKAAMTFCNLTKKWHAITYVVFQWLCGSILMWHRRELHRVCISEGGDHWGPSGRLATTPSLEPNSTGLPF